MTQQERTELIREVKDLLQIQETHYNNHQEKLFNDKTMKAMESVLIKCLSLSI